MSNDSGEYHRLRASEFDDLLSLRTCRKSGLFQDLKGKDFVYEKCDDLVHAVERIATRLRTRKKFMRDFTALHMLVVTLRCNHRCEYCQVSSEDADAIRFDMSPETARRIVDTIFCTPSPTIKIEFQGGEPLLNWPAIEAAVLHAKGRNETIGKHLAFIVCTNLMGINAEMLAFFKEHDVRISTSLDGPRDLHDENRKLRIGTSSHDHFVAGLELSRKVLGHDAVSALMTTTRLSLDSFPEIIDEYLRLGFDGIFFRALNPYGFAHAQAGRIGYSTEAYLKAYKAGLDYIIALNLSTGRLFPEYFTTLLLSRILTPFSTGFVDLQSPSGAGISGAIYDYNGDVYPADEARMLARMGDKHFLMGNVFTHSHGEIFRSDILRKVVAESCLEILPGCADCVYLPYCGSDPIRSYLEHGDLKGRRAGSGFCEKHKAVFDHLFDLLHANNPDVIDVFWSWITHRPLQEIRLEDR